MKKFLKAVGRIDEELLERYDNIEKSLIPKRKRTHVLKTAVIAACFCVIFGSIFAVLRFTGETELPFYSDITSENEGFESSKAENQSKPDNESSGTVSAVVSNPEQSDVSDNVSNSENSNVEVSDNESSNSDVSDGESSIPDISGGETSNGETSVPTPPSELNHTMSDEPLWMNPAVAANGNSYGAQQAEPSPPYVLFGMGMTAVGKVQQILPDTYARLDSLSAEPRYRVIVMEITESVYGKNLPSEIYLTVPTYLDVNVLLNYDEILFAFKQKGFENYVLANETQKRAEAFSMMFETIPGYPEFCFVPFTDGVLDISLWREKGWKNGFYKEEYMLKFFDDRDNFLVMIGDTLEQAKEAVLGYVAEMRYPPLNRVLYSEIFAYDEAKEVLAHCKPFENGIYSQEAYVQNKAAIFFVRHIYGFATNEMIRISEKDGDVTYYGEAFTEEEIAKLPNIADFFENTNLDSLSPMHTDIPNGFETSKPMLSGKYIKHGGKIYSVARVAWRMTGELNNESGCYLDDSYFIISEDGSATLIEREELRTLTGDDTFITNFTYNEFLPTVYE